MRPFLFLVILTSILTGCTSNPPTYSIGGSEFLTFEQAAAALMEESAPGEGALGLDQPTRLIHAVPFPYPREGGEQALKEESLSKWKLMSVEMSLGRPSSGSRTNSWQTRQSMPSVNGNSDLTRTAAHRSRRDFVTQSLSS